MASRADPIRLSTRLGGEERTLANGGTEDSRGSRVDPNCAQGNHHLMDCRFEEAALHVNYCGRHGCPNLPVLIGSIPSGKRVVMISSHGSVQFALVPASQSAFRCDCHDIDHEIVGLVEGSSDIYRSSRVFTVNSLQKEFDRAKAGWKSERLELSQKNEALERKQKAQEEELTAIRTLLRTEAFESRIDPECARDSHHIVDSKWEGINMTVRSCNRGGCPKPPVIYGTVPSGQRVVRLSCPCEFGLAAASRIRCTPHGTVFEIKDLIDGTNGMFSTRNVGASDAQSLKDEISNLMAERKKDKKGLEDQLTSTKRQLSEQEARRIHLEEEQAAKELELQEAKESLRHADNELDSNSVLLEEERRTNAELMNKLKDLMDPSRAVDYGHSVRENVTESEKSRKRVLDDICLDCLERKRIRRGERMDQSAVGTSSASSSSNSVQQQSCACTQQ